MRSIIVPTNSGSATRQQSTAGLEESNRIPAQNLRDSTFTMWSHVKAIPSDIAGIVYGFRSKEGRYKESLLGPWPRVTTALAATGQAKYSDLMAPVMEHGARLKRQFFCAQLPTLADAEQEQADAECALRKAEIRLEREHSERARTEARHAALEEMLAAQTVLEVVDVTPMCAVIGGTK